MAWPVLVYNVCMYKVVVRGLVLVYRVRMVRPLYVHICETPHHVYTPILYTDTSAAHSSEYRVYS